MIMAIIFVSSLLSLLVYYIVSATEDESIKSYRSVKETIFAVIATEILSIVISTILLKGVFHGFG